MLPSIFDLRGPEFLALYILVGCGVLLLVRARIRAQELEDAVPRVNPKEPLTIAFLRGGSREVLRVVAFSLVDRGLLLFDGQTLCARPGAASVIPRNPLEKAMLSRYAKPARVDVVLADTALQSACDQYADTLRAAGLVASAETYAARRPVFVLGLAILAGLAGTKIMVALSRGHSNVLFLFILALIFVGILSQIYRRQRTGQGDQALANLKLLLAGRQARSKLIKAGEANDDALLLAAVYGLGALPTENFPYLKKLFPKGSRSSSSCGSSSCGSSCGSGCGGGGCGGGCGGCGS
jgi:uncharacterized protein (TIGR04222 family)